MDSTKINTKKDITPLEIGCYLSQKYCLSYSFYTTKYINQLIYSVGNSLSIQFENQVAYHDDVEYLRRSYRNVGLNGKKEIQQRIKLVSKYYEHNRITSPQLPMMIITQVNDIIIRRTKRLRRLKQNTSNPQSQKPSSSFGNGSLSFSFDQDFLKDLNLQITDLMDSSSSQLLNEPQHCRSSHDIYENFADQINLSTQQIMKFKENTVEHLICDFEEIDAQSVIKFYKEIKNSKNGSTIISEIIEQEQKLSKMNSQKQIMDPLPYNFSCQLPLQKNKKSSQIQKQRVLSNYMQIFGLKSKSRQHKQSYTKQRIYSTHFLAAEQVAKYKNTWQTNVQNAEQQIEKRKSDLKKNRIRVRQKAQRLLEIIQKDSLTLQLV